MRTGVVALVMLVALSGCIASQPDDPEPAEPPVVDDSHVETPAKIIPTERGRSYRLDIHDLEYHDEMLRVAIVTDEMVNVTFAAETYLPALHQDDGCAALAGTAHSGGRMAFNVVLANFHGENDMPVIVRAAGQEVVVLPDQEQTFGSVAEPQGLNETFRVPAGTRFELALGGRDPSVRESAVHGDSGAESGRHWVQLDVHGRSHVEALPPVPVRCGMGPRQLEDPLAGGSAWLAQAGVDGEVALETTAGSSMIWLAAQMLDLHDVDLVFHEERVQAPPAFFRSAPDPGRLAVEAATWAELVPETAWLLADAHWPVLEQLRGQ